MLSSQGRRDKRLLTRVCSRCMFPPPPLHPHLSPLAQSYRLSLSAAIRVQGRGMKGLQVHRRHQHDLYMRPLRAERVERKRGSKCIQMGLRFFYILLTQCSSVCTFWSWCSSRCRLALCSRAINVNRLFLGGRCVRHVSPLQRGPSLHFLCPSLPSLYSDYECYKWMRC